MYDVAIVGGGPAGLTAAIYAKRANKNVVVFEAVTCGGQIINTTKIDNYPAAPQNLPNRLKSLAPKLSTRR